MLTVCPLNYNLFTWRLIDEYLQVTFDGFFSLLIISTVEKSIAATGGDEQAIISREQAAAREKQEREDHYFALALSLAGEVETQAKGPTPKKLVCDAALQKAVQAMTAQKQEMDVHAFNRAVVIPHRQTLLTALAEVGAQTNLSFETVCAELAQRIDTKSIPQLEASLMRLKAHIKTPVDGETGLNVPQLFSAVWSLYKIQETSTHQHLPGQGNHLGYIAYSLAESLNTNGGCYPGYAGRLARDAFMLLASTGTSA